MRVLIIGNGGREAAIAKKLSEDSRISHMFFAKGNATTEQLGENVYLSEIPDLVKFAKKEAIDLTIVGPEAPLVDGIVDEFEKEGLRIFGPKKKIARLEGSKSYAKKFMKEYGVKTANAEIFTSYTEAKSYIESQTKFPIVVKASGLAAGKGVVIAENKEEALTTIHEFMIDRKYGDAGIEVVIEDYLKGFETSIIAFSNGKEFFPCISAKDYKKVGEGDKGANTGGMGTVAPCPNFTDAHFEDFKNNVLQPTLDGLKDKYLMFNGFIFFGLLIANDECYLLEYNMRSGDPETQVIMELLDSNLLDIIDNCIDGNKVDLNFKNEKAVCLVMASGGYPGNYDIGYEITNLDKVKNSTILLAGAKYKGDDIVTNGGRVINVVATGETYEEARKKVYEDALSINFDYAFYREDIAKF